MRTSNMYPQHPTGLTASQGSLTTPRTKPPTEPTPVCRQIGNWDCCGLPCFELHFPAAQENLKLLGLAPRPAWIIESSPEGFPASPSGRPETGVGYSLRRIVDRKPHQDSPDSRAGPKCELPPVLK
ncbi:hypothetical protein AOLI_G00269490 [Acnodon oligacanthus]